MKKVKAKSQRAPRAAPIERKPGRLIGYARVSTDDQTLDPQIEALLKYGVPRGNVYAEKSTGAHTKRQRLQAALKAIRPESETHDADRLVVTRLDRLGRDLGDLVRALEGLKERGSGLVSLNEHIDTDNAIGTFMFHILASLAQFERNLIRERTQAGLASARAQGRSGGRPRSLTVKDEERMVRTSYTRRHGVTLEAHAAKFGVSLQTLRNARFRAREREKKGKQLRIARDVIYAAVAAIREVGDDQ